MSIDFEKLLTESIGRTNEPFERACEALRDVTLRASEALEKASEGRLSLRLRDDDVREGGTLFRLMMIRRPPPDPADARFLYALFVPATGFPLLKVQGDHRFLELNGEAIVDQPHLERVFAELFSSDASPVLLTLAWLRRHKLDATGT